MDRLRSHMPVLGLLILAALTSASSAGARSRDPRKAEFLPAALTIRPTHIPVIAKDGPRTLTLPLAHGGPPNVAARINQRLHPETVLGAPLETATSVADRGDARIIGAEYRVNFQDANALSLTIALETAAGDKARQHLNFDPATGRELTAAEIFVPGSAPALVALMDPKVQFAVAYAKKHGPEEGTPDIAERLDGAAFTATDLETVYFTEDGFAFEWRSGLVGVYEGVDPAGVYTLMWPDAAPWVAPRFAEGRPRR